MRRLFAVLFAVTVVAAAAIGSRALGKARAQAVRRDTARAAEQAAAQTGDALATQIREIKLEARNAAANPRLVAALRGNADAATLQDLFRTEEWWEPYRNAFKVYAVAFEGDKLDVVGGIATAEFASAPLIRQAREHGEAAEIVRGKGWPYEAAAASVELPGRAIPAVLLLAKPIDGAAVDRLADKARGAVVISDGAHTLVAAGADGERELLRSAIGSEAEAVYHVADGTWAAAASPIAPGLWSWTFASGAAAAHDADSATVTSAAIIWSIAALLAAAGLLLGLRRGAAAPAARAPTSAAVFAGHGEPRPPTPASSRGAGASAAHAVAGGGNGGVRFGRYLLLDQLGEGGMAQVYTAVTFGAEGFRRRFVVKRLRAELTREPEVVAQFIDEANLASTLVHSNIIPVFDFGNVSGEYFLAQEYILGRDLGRLTARVLESARRPLSAAVALYAAAETLRALEYAHGKLDEAGRPVGLVHRDVSPSNVLVSARGEIKLFDFGIVKAEGRVTKTQQGVVKGNVSFMSPEQARGLNVDARADLFSLGMVMFYCLTGEVLYRGDTTFELLVKAATGPGADEQRRIAALPAPCADIVAKALHVDPTRRYQTAAEFGAAVGPHVAGGRSEAVALMTELFAADFRAEEAAFAAAMPTAERAAPATGASATDAQPRRS